MLMVGELGQDLIESDPRASSSSVSPLEIRDPNQLAALTLTLSRAGNGTGEGSLLSIVFGRPEVMNTLW
jgi:hypothetical protein